VLDVVGTDVIEGGGFHGLMLQAERGVC
jgi:hypothetical protein